ncbi:MAG: M28 family peptidase [Gemmatimonadaceae bacterium]
MAYLTRQFVRAGLRPGNSDRTYVQWVPLTAVRVRAAGSYTAGGKTVELRSPEDFTISPGRAVPELVVRGSDVVFAGYGLVASEHGWDAYRGLDLHGKTAMLLFGDPPASSAGDSARIRNLINTWQAQGLGSWRQRVQMAVQRGAAAVITVHETAAAGLSYEAIAGSGTRERMQPTQASADTTRPFPLAIMRLDVARRLIAAGGGDFERLKRQAAASVTFTPVPLGVEVNFRVSYSMGELRTRNVVARLDGSDPALAREYVLYTAHWDHLGRDEALAGDQTYNGAIDNAGGTAQLLEIAEAFTRLRPPPRRTILFMATAAEEQGLLGARYYATHPLHPLEHTVAVINLDWFFPWGRTRDVLNIGHGNTTLDDVLTDAARHQGRTVTPDPWAEQNYFLRSDQFPFVERGIPALFVGAGLDYTGRPADWGKSMMSEYEANHYHRVSDEIRPGWDYSGAAEDARLLFDVGYRVAQSTTRPRWKTTTAYPAFRAAHAALLRRAGVSR